MKAANGGNGGNGGAGGNGDEQGAEATPTTATTHPQARRAMPARAATAGMVGPAVTRSAHPSTPWRARPPSKATTSSAAMLAFPGCGAAGKEGADRPRPQGRSPAQGKTVNRVSRGPRMSDATGLPPPEPAAEAQPDFTSLHTGDFPRATLVAGHLARRLHVPGRQADLRPQRRRPAQHALPPIRFADGGRLRRRGSGPGRRHAAPGLDVPRPSPRVGQARSARQARRGLPAARNTHFSGDIRIHEIGWIGDEIWGVNTRLSCLTTFDREHSFVPRWRPPSSPPTPPKTAVI